jgi:hypothetical protein
MQLLSRGGVTVIMVSLHSVASGEQRTTTIVVWVLFSSGLSRRGLAG